MSAAAAALAPTSTRHLVMMMVFACAMITYMDRACMSIAAPPMRSELGLTEVQFGYVFGAFNLAYGIMEMPAAWLGDRWGQRVTLVRIVTGWSIFTILTGAVRSYWQLLLTRFLFGMGEAGAFPTLSRALARWYPAHFRGRANGLMWAGARLGGAVAPPLAVLLVTGLGWRSSFAVFGVLGLAWCLLCAWWFRDDPSTHRGVNRAELDLIRVGAAPAPASHEKTPWGRILTDRTLLALFASYFASGFGFQFFVTWLPTYFIREHGLTFERSGVFASLPLLAGAAGCLVGGLLADWLSRRLGSVTLGRRIVGVGGFTIGAIGFVSAVTARTPEAAIFWLVVAAGAHDMILPVLWATCVDAGGKFGGTSAGFVNFASCVSGVAAPIAAPKLAVAFGSFASIFYVSAALYVVGAAMWFVVRTPRQSE